MAAGRIVDELLERLWLEEEAGRLLRKDMADGELAGLDLNQAIADAGALGLVAEEEDTLSLSRRGRDAARELIRRHRLAERLMTDVLEMSAEDMESDACRFEHLLGEGVTRSICVLLGHPTTCPHGKPIPPGDCCHAGEQRAEPVLVPLTQLFPHDRAQVVYIATRHHQRLDHLASLGLTPGVEVRLHQRRPSYILFVGETNLAIDESVAADIYVRRLDASPPLEADGGPQPRRRRGWFR